MKKLVIFILLLIYTGINVNADNIVFKATSDQVVAMGSRFKIIFNVNIDNPSDFQAPEMNDFEILMGPRVSTGTQSFIINGNVTTKKNTSYTYVVTPKKEGTFTIAPAKIKIDGKIVMSNALTIKVLASDQAKSDNSNINKLFARITYSKNNVYENEQIIATVKLYYIDPVSSLSKVEYPEYNGFIVQDIELTNEERQGLESYNGKNYKTYTLRKSILFPQKVGSNTIGDGKIYANVQVKGEKVNSFFGSYYNTYNVEKIISIPKTKIEVQPLPTKGKPENFSGAVGSFKLESSINTEEIKANDALNINVKITGTGNIKYVKNPAIVFPNDFEVYDPKINTKVSNTKAGTSGSKNIEYIAIPRYAGNYEIPAAKFSFFDPKTKKYKTLETKAFNIVVEKGDAGSNNNQVISNYSSKENIKYLGKDIRFINTNDLQLQKENDFIFGSTLFWLGYIIPAFILILVFFIYRKQAKENANITLVKNKKANKKARKRLKQAEKHLQENNKSAFYEEVLKALWGYTSDKLNIPVSELNKDNIENQLTERQVSEDVIREFMEILQTCEFARFAPIESENAMDDLFEKAVNLISQLEEQVKKA